ncbi:MAG: hypothetical protein LQ344_004117 [Seirophora lacunosa]|nr:MAG: hypothetical protein LQ344_004117 [Seirophora lacunosa]
MDVSPASHRPGRMPSPTLTNPDMILPDSGIDHSASPPRHTDDPSNLPQWSSQAVGDDSQMKSALRTFFGNGHRLRHRNSEKAFKSQESIDVRPQSKQSELSHPSANSALASSPLLHEGFGIRSMGENPPNAQNTGNADSLDDGSVISESISPLVDAEREEFLMNEDAAIEGYKFSDRFRQAIVEEDDEPYSQATMSVRAEEILANAKKRLTEMESNLNRARHTINRPSSSMSSFLTSSSDAPSMYTLPKNTSPSKHRHHHSPPSNSKGHSRVFSETSLPSSMQTLPPDEEDHANDVPSSNAMGSIDRNTAADTGGRTKHGPEARDWFWTGLTRNTSHGPRHKNYGLQPLNEDGPPPSTFEPPERQQSPPLVEDTNEVVPSQQENLDHSAQESGNPSSTGLTRARSTNQMRDIRDQMQDLKGKISSLKQRAREDSLRRRSLQSLRDPSPFTAAEQWYTGAPTHDRDRSRSRPREGSPPAVQPAIEEEDRTKHYPVQQPDLSAEGGLEPTTNGSSGDSGSVQEHPPSASYLVARGNDDSPKTVIETSDAAEEAVADEARFEEPASLSEEVSKEGNIESEEEDFDDLSTLPVGGRHEDRPDAFDYEHLFLHSGMGTLGRKGNSRSSSHSSTYSIETTKPSNVTTEASEISNDGNASLDDAGVDMNSSNSHSNSGHERKGSVESVSTVATFATATEGESSDEAADEDEWVYSRPMAGSWEPEYPGHRMVPTGRRDGEQHQTNGSDEAQQSQSPARPRGNSSGRAGSGTEAAADDSSLEGTTPDLLAFLTCKLPVRDKVRPRAIELNDSDKELAERLIRSVAQVCSQLQAFSMEGNKYGGRPWRRRLDSARRLLDGETNGEVF